LYVFSINDFFKQGIKVEDSPNEVTINVKDDGTGIPEGKQKDLFNKFYQVDLH